MFDQFKLPGFSPRAVLRATEAAIVLGLAAQTARMVWILVTPLGPLGEPPAAAAGPGPQADLAVFERFDPFHRVADIGPAHSATAAGGGEGMRLFGVRVGPDGGSAIIGTPDGRQNAFGVGETVDQGYVLRVVATDHVLLARAGSRLRLTFSPSTAEGVPPPPPPPVAAASPASAGIDPQQLLAAAALTPNLREGRLEGYRLAGRGGGEPLRRAGLQPGDVLLAVDGSALNPERLAELPQILASADEVELRFQRAGQVMTTRIRIAQ